jgi:hypothetical protein
MNFDSDRQMDRRSMLHRERLRSLVLATAIAAVLAAPGMALEFKSRGEQDLESIFSTLALHGRFNIIVSPRVTRTKMVLNFKDLEPRAAVELVARLNNLAVKELPAESSDSVPTLVVGVAADIAAGFDTYTSRVVRLGYAQAVQVATELATQIGKEDGVRVGADTRTNSVLISGHPAQIERLAELIHALDLPVPQFSVAVSLVLDGKDKEPLWVGQVDVRNGQRSSFACSQDPIRSESRTPARIGKLAGWLNAACNKDNFLNLQIHVGGDLDLGGNPVRFGTTLSAQLKDGETREIYRVVLAGGRVLSIRINPVVRQLQLSETPAAVPAPAPSARPAPPERPTPGQDLGNINLGDI